MTESPAVSAPSQPGAPKDVRPPALDATDLRILAILERDARIPNNALAAAVGIAPSTCLGRVRALREAGVIRGFYAELDPAALGRGLQAMVAVRMQADARDRLEDFAHEIATSPEVQDVYFLAGHDDFLLHVAVSDTEALRVFVVERLSSRTEVAGTQTSLIFEHLSGLRARR